MVMPRMMQNVVILIVFILWTLLLVSVDIPLAWRRIKSRYGFLKAKYRCQQGVTELHPEYYTHVVPKNSHRKDNVFPCFKGVFNDTLIVVTYNSPYYENIEVINKLYNKVFGKVVHCGGEATKADKYSPDIVTDVCGGHCGYVCMARAMEKYRGYKGYLYVNDDMVVNWWRLLDFDRKKVWQGPEIINFEQGAYEEIKNKEWMWWEYPVGLAACRESYQALSLAAKEDESLNRALDIYIKNGKGKPRCGKGWSDFFYVPGHLADTCRKLLDTYEKHKLFLEISVINVLHSLDFAENFEVVKGIFLPDLWLVDPANGREFWGVYNTSITFIHPFKYGFQDFADMNKALVKNWILEITNSLTSC